VLLDFYKYEGAGNDFILIDDRRANFPQADQQLIKRLCDRRFGIGADGLMLLQDLADYDFSMRYFNSDGKESSMCGNGGRCIAAFASKLGIIQRNTRFLAIDGVHLAEIVSEGYVRLKMIDVKKIETGKDFYYLDTGSPHYVTFRPAIHDLNIREEGRKIRYNKRFGISGTNVNFVEDQGTRIFVRTYERGVEDETMACGTGVVASAICSVLMKKDDNYSGSLPVKVPGGTLQVSLSRNGKEFTNIWLEGPATFVFHGEISIYPD
jgi:diaminopimelate epimerase